MSAAQVKPAIEADEWRTAQSQFDRAAEIIKLEPWLRDVLREVQREFTCNFPVKMDDGHLRIFTGYRVQHNINRGPAKGGIRYHPDVSLNEVKALASMPGKEELYSKLLFLISAPAQRLVTTLSAVGRDLAVVVNQGVMENKFAE